MKKNHLFFLCTWIIVLSTLVSCETTNLGTEEDTDICGPKYITLTGKVNNEEVSRAYWSEDTPSGDTLLFHWENDNTAQMQCIVQGGNRIKMFEGNPTTTTTIQTSTDHTLCNLDISKPLDKGYVYEQDDKLHLFYPVAQTSSIIKSGQDISFSFSIPNSIKNVLPNDTKHLRPYIFMMGSGAVQITDGEAHSQLDFRTFPAIIQFKIRNSDNRPLEIRELSLTGNIAMTGNVTLDKSGQESIQFTKEKNSVGVTTNITLKANEEKNFYVLALPTEFDQTEYLSFNFRGAYNDNWGANYEDLQIPCTALTDSSNKFVSNQLYTLFLNVEPEVIKMQVGELSIKSPVKGGEGNIEIGPNNQ